MIFWSRSLAINSGFLTVVLSVKLFAAGNAVSLFPVGVGVVPSFLGPLHFLLNCCFNNDPGLAEN